MVDLRGDEDRLFEYDFFDKI